MPFLCKIVKLFFYHKSGFKYLYPLYSPHDVDSVFNYFLRTYLVFLSWVYCPKNLWWALEIYVIFQF